MTYYFNRQVAENAKVLFMTPSPWRLYWLLGALGVLAVRKKEATLWHE
jgi:hypothetical protein